ncbi:glycosyltransferase [Flavobacteriaceae bacterium AU392]|nr:glycosyltransferase [Flavobacteriaceae bacterium]RKM85091.1 glycosyltransferase [Flavobacteriaceae bacterium AU392]
MGFKKRILIAPLNWGLGHATRCIPIINELIAHHFEPIIASDGKALLLLKKEFPNLTTIELPSYHIKYPKNGSLFRIKLLFRSLKILKAVYKEQKKTDTIIASYRIDGIISDNRLGVFSKVIPSVYITHQLHVLSGFTTFLSSKLHHFFIKKFDQCWIPDNNEKLSLSGKLGHLNYPKFNLKYIGVLSRFKEIQTSNKYNLFVMLSGPEPQRSIFEKLLLNKLKDYKGKVLFVKGKIENEQKTTIKNNITIVNFMQSDALQLAINQSDLILCRSGYTSVMDLVKLGKKAFFIPTPGQFEQEYLAKRLEQLNFAPMCKQSHFNLKQLNRISNYKGLSFFNKNTVDFKLLFRLFDSK